MERRLWLLGWREEEDEEEEEDLIGLIPNGAKKPESQISARLSPNEADAVSLPSS